MDMQTVSLSATYDDEHSHKYYSIYFQIIGTIVNSLIFAIGILGNILVVLVVVVDRSRSSMQTPTNCYLASLAIADLVVLLATVPNEILTYYIRLDKWLTGLIGCQIFLFSYNVGINASALSLVAFTSERYVAICKPMRAHAMCTVKRAKKIIAVVWIFTLCYSCPWVILVELKILEQPNINLTKIVNTTAIDDMQCTWKYFRGFYFSFFLTDLVLFYALPLCVTLYLYICIGRALFFYSSTDVQLDRSTEKHAARKQVVKMLAVVVLVFAALWLPYRGLLVYNSINGLIGRELFLNDWFLMFAKSCIYANCAINPILYNAMSLKFRRAFKRLLCGVYKSRYRPNRSLINRSSTTTHYSLRLRPVSSVSSKSTIC